MNCNDYSAEAGVIRRNTRLERKFGVTHTLKAFYIVARGCGAAATPGEVRRHRYPERVAHGV